jgi:hypothetical protein
MIKRQRQESMFPPTPPATIRRRRASFESELGSVPTPAKPRNKATRPVLRDSVLPAWTAEYHGTTEHTPIKVFKPAGICSPLTHSRDKSAQSSERDWVALRCFNVDPDVGSEDLNRFLKSVISYELGQRVNEPKDQLFPSFSCPAQSSTSNSYETGVGLVEAKPLSRWQHGK